MFLLIPVFCAMFYLLLRRLPDSLTVDFLYFGPELKESLVNWPILALIYAKNVSLFLPCFRSVRVSGFLALGRLLQHNVL